MESGLSQKDVAFIVGLSSDSRVAEHERDRGLPRLETALAYVVLFGKHPNEVFKGLYEEVELMVHNGAQALHGRLEDSGRLTNQQNTFLRHLMKNSVGDLLGERDVDK